MIHGLSYLVPGIQYRMPSMTQHITPGMTPGGCFALSKARREIPTKQNGSTQHIHVFETIALGRCYLDSIDTNPPAVSLSRRGVPRASYAGVPEPRSNLSNQININRYMLCHLLPSGTFPSSSPQTASRRVSRADFVNGRVPHTMPHTRLATNTITG